MMMMKTILYAVRDRVLLIHHLFVACPKEVLTFFSPLTALALFFLFLRKISSWS